MKIKQINVYAVLFDSVSYSRLRLLRTGPKPKTQDTVVCIETDDGLTGFGESCPLPPNYLPSSAASVRAGIALVAPAIIGADPLGVRAVSDRMDEAALGFPEAKTAIDMACWDLLGKATKLPCHTLFGGRRVEQAPLFESVAIDDPETMVRDMERLREAGIRVFQVKVGEGADKDIPRIRALVPLLEVGETMLIDANRGWSTQDALRVLPLLERIVEGRDVWIEQPGITYEECLALRARTTMPFLLDEVIDGAADLQRAIADRALDGVVVKVAHCGGPSKALDLIRIALSAGIKVRIEDTSGTDLVRSAVAHLSATVPARSLIATYAFPETDYHIGVDDTITGAGMLKVGNAEGLGVQVDLHKLGTPIATYK